MYGSLFDARGAMANRIVRNPGVRIASAIALVVSVMTSPIPSWRLSVGVSPSMIRGCELLVLPTHATPVSATAVARPAVWVKAVLRQNEEIPRGIIGSARCLLELGLAAFSKSARDMAPFSLERANYRLRC